MRLQFSVSSYSAWYSYLPGVVAEQDAPVAAAVVSGATVVKVTSRGVSDTDTDEETTPPGEHDSSSSSPTSNDSQTEADSNQGGLDTVDQPGSATNSESSSKQSSMRSKSSQGSGRSPASAVVPSVAVIKASDKSERSVGFI